MKNKILLLLIILLFGGCRGTRLVNAVTHHPHYNDSNTLDWISFDDALKTDNKILIDYGRKGCKYCKIFIEKVLPQFKDSLKEYVGVAEDADAPSPKVKELITKFASQADKLPIIIVLDKKHNFAGMLYGNITIEEFKKLIK